MECLDFFIVDYYCLNRKRFVRIRELLNPLAFESLRKDVNERRNMSLLLNFHKLIEYGYILATNQKLF